MRMLLTLCYDGSAYHGWQVQSNALAVQPVVQDALERILGHRPGVSGCSRTDAGVHAREYCCHFDTQKRIAPEQVVSGLNFALPRDIAARDCKVVQDDFHARYSCTGKEYIYQIYNGKTRSPFYEKYALYQYHRLDEQLLHDAAQGFVGRHDFAGFCAVRAKEGSSHRTVRLAQVEREGDLVRFIVQADGFLYNMVRIMVGTLLHVNAGRINAQDITDIVASGDRRRAGPTAPAHGLFLNRVFYSDLGKAVK